VTPAAEKLQALLAEPGLRVMPCCFDALSAKLVERAGFPASFMSGFAVAAARLGLPDTGLISYGEMLDQGRNICAAVEIPGPCSRISPACAPRSASTTTTAPRSAIGTADARTRRRSSKTPT
jgi:hypothetical protein